MRHGGWANSVGSCYTIVKYRFPLSSLLCFIDLSPTGIIPKKMCLLLKHLAEEAAKTGSTL